MVKIKNFNVVKPGDWTLALGNESEVCEQVLLTANVVKRFQLVTSKNSQMIKSSPKHSASKTSRNTTIYPN